MYIAPAGVYNIDKVKLTSQKADKAPQMLPTYGFQLCCDKSEASIEDLVLAFLKVWLSTEVASEQVCVFVCTNVDAQCRMI